MPYHWSLISAIAVRVCFCEYARVAIWHVAYHIVYWLILASTGTNIALNKIGRLMDYFLLSFFHDFMAIAAWLDRAKWHIHTRWIRYILWPEKPRYKEGNLWANVQFPRDKFGPWRLCLIQPSPLYLWFAIYVRGAQSDFSDAPDILFTGWWV